MSETITRLFIASNLRNCSFSFDMVRKEIEMSRRTIYCIVFFAIFCLCMVCSIVDRGSWAVVLASFFCGWTVGINLYILSKGDPK